MKFAKFGKDCKVQLHSETKPFMELVKESSDHLRQQGKEEPFFLVDLGDIIKKFEAWKGCLPRVKPFYAVKANEEPDVLRLLAHLGTGFDCASKREMSEILGMGVDPSRIIYAHTCKPSTDIRYAAQMGVDLMTFDNEEELRKIKTLYPTTRLLLRMMPPANFKVLHELGNKFGCHPLDAPSLLRTAWDLKLDVVGVSFHVGCGAEDPQMFAVSVQNAATVFEEAEALGFTFTILDVGGGFPSSLQKFRQVARVLGKALDAYFPEERNVQLMAEPGRYFVEAAFSLTVTVIAKRRGSKHVRRNEDGEEGQQGEEVFGYYINDGVFGSINCVLVDLSHQDLEARLVTPPENPEEYPSTVWGPTCDGIDKVLSGVMLPELQVGDILNFEDMGAYSLTTSTSFNGIPRPLILFHCVDTVWENAFPANQPA